MFFSESKEYLLDHDDDLQCCNESCSRRERKSTTGSLRKLTTLPILVALSLSVALNVFNFLHRGELHDVNHYHGPTQYSHLPFDSPTTYQAFTDYWGDNETVSDQLWEELDANPVAIALTDTYATQHGLPLSARFPWDDEKKVLRRSFVNSYRNLEQTISAGHVNRCLDAIRQDVVCKADDTPMPITKIKHTVGNDQVMECRDWNKLVEWTQAPEQQACYKMIDDYTPIVHSLERHQFCPEYSPYYPVMKAYFDIHGHKDPFSA